MPSALLWEFANDALKKVSEVQTLAVTCVLWYTG